MVLAIQFTRITTISKLFGFSFLFSHFSIVNLFNPHQFDIKVHVKWIFDTNAYINASKCMNSTLYRVNCFQWTLRLKLKHKIEEKKKFELKTIFEYATHTVSLWKLLELNTLAFWLVYP